MKNRLKEVLVHKQAPSQNLKRDIQRIDSSENLKSDTQRSILALEVFKILFKNAEIIKKYFLSIKEILM